MNYETMGAKEDSLGEPDCNVLVIMPVVDGALL